LAHSFLTTFKISEKLIAENSLREKASLSCDHLWQSFSNKKPQRTWILKHPRVRFLRLWFWTKAKSSTPDL